MKLLRVSATNFKLCEDNFTISFIPEANKSAEDKEFELHEINDNLFTYTTVAVVGKNASGKSTVVDLLAMVYEILTGFRVKNMNDVFINNKPIHLDIVFYHEGFLYRYVTDLEINNFADRTVLFKNEILYKKEHLKSYVKNIYNFEKYKKIETDINLPEDTSVLYLILRKIEVRGMAFDLTNPGANTYAYTFELLHSLDNEHKLIIPMLNILDEHIKNIKMIDKDKFEILFSYKEKEIVTGKELHNILSSGTNKGLSLFTFVVYSLLNGCDLVIDEIENHFHKTLVENLINLYKDKSVNKKNATLIFTTHYCELLDLFNRSDNIYITKYEDTIRLENLYRNYNLRPELSKSKKFYNNAFNTGVNYESLMNFKKELMK